MSRFGPTDPWYRKMEADLMGERIERLVQADAERYRRQMAARPLRAPVVDRDPGDEDATP